MSSSTLPKGSLVLVTGVNGFIASHVADQFLQAGYRVRGTARTVAKAQPLIDLWEKQYGPGKFELVTVSDMSSKGAFDEAVKGVSAIAHLASIVTFEPDPNKVIPEVLAGVREILNSAVTEPSIKSFVYTSSSTAASLPKPNKEFIMDANTWNEESIKEAWAPPPYEPSRAWATYAASKTQGEQEIWKFVKEQNPSFSVNAVLPNANYGPLLYKDQPGSTGAWVRRLYTGEDIDSIKDIPPQWFVDVRDTARIHVATAINLNVKNERIYAFAETYTFNDILRILRKLRPNQKFIENIQDDNLKDLSKVANGSALELLKGMGRPGWISLEDSVRDAIATF